MHGLPRFSAFLDPMLLFPGPGSVPCRRRVPCPSVLMLRTGPGVEVLPCAEGLPCSGLQVQILISFRDSLAPRLETHATSSPDTLSDAAVTQHQPSQSALKGRRESGGPASGQRKQTSPLLLLSYQLCFCCQAPGSRSGTKFLRPCLHFSNTF